MSLKKIALTGAVLALGLGFVLTEAYAQTAQNQTETKQQTRSRVRTMFMDQNGDGINDSLRDSDNDGIPNCQDPDWTRPQDGTGSKMRHGSVGAGAGQHPGMSKDSFRSGTGLGQFGTGVCDGTGPKGKAARKGRR
jgi:hypothetical protein